MAGERRRVRVEAHDLTVTELVGAFRRHCEAECIDKHDLSQFRSAWTPLIELYGATPAATFGPMNCAEEPKKKDNRRLIGG